MLFPVYGVSLFVSVNLEQFGLKYLYPLPLRHVCNWVWFSQGFLWKLSGTMELENFVRRKVMLRKSSGRESAWTLRCHQIETIGTELLNLTLVCPQLYLEKEYKTWFLSSRGI